MSVRAYKLITKEYADTPTFNLWHSDLVMELLNIEALGLASENGGDVEIMKDDIEDALKELEAEEKGNKEYKDTKEVLEQMLEECEGKDSVEYVCF